MNVQAIAETSTGHKEVRVPLSKKLWRYSRRQPGALVSAVFLLLLLVLAIFRDLIMPYDPNAQDLSVAHRTPSAENLLGTDQFGRDVLSRLIDATAITVTAPIIAVSVAILLGLTTGLLAGYRGGRIDWFLSLVADTLLSLPAVVMAIAILAMFGPNLTNAMIAIGIAFAPRLFRVARGAVLSVREELFIESAKSVGASESRILYSHVLPNIASPILVQVTLMMGFSVLAEASLSFLGLATQPPDASWGAMLQTAYENQFRAPFQVVPPGIAITLTILAFNTLGDGVRDLVAGRRTR